MNHTKRKRAHTARVVDDRLHRPELQRLLLDLLEVVRHLGGHALLYAELSATLTQGEKPS